MVEYVTWAIYGCVLYIVEYMAWVLYGCMLDMVESFVRVSIGLCDVYG